MAAIKIGVTQAAKLTPEPLCTPVLTALSITGYGAAV